MHEYAPIANLLGALPFEPKRLNRFMVTFVKNDDTEGITHLNTWVIKQIQRPAIEYINGEKTYHPLVMVFNDPIGPSVTQAVMKSFDNNEIFSYTLEIVDPTGEVVERWEIRDCKIIGLDFGNLSYDDTGVAQVIVAFKPREIQLIF